MATTTVYLMKLHFIASLVVLSLGALFVGAAFFYQSRKPDPVEKISRFEQMQKSGVPDIEVKDIYEKPFKLSDYHGKIIIINFWASWCSPCIEEIPSLIKLLEEFKGQIHLVAVSGDYSIEDIQVFLKSFPTLKHEHISLLWDYDKTLMNGYGVEALPESYIVGTDHLLVKKIVGSINWYTEDSKSYIKSLLKK